MNQNTNTFISKRIKKGLKEAKLSQTQLANMIDKSRAYVSNITQGRYTPKVSELLRIAEFLNKPIGFFFGEDAPGLMHYVDKAKKWDKVVSMIDRNMQTDMKNDAIAIPLVDITKAQNKSADELIMLKKSTKEFIYLSQSYLREHLKFFKPADSLVAVKVFIRDYPEFGLNIGDLIVFEQIPDNDIGDDSGKLFTIIYNNQMGIKRIYKEGNEYYFEPMHSNPQVDRIHKNDPNLIIPGRIVLTMQTKMY
ncbi:helix-turn-helix transcriptional regulator [Patescibacteria group bacterium]